MSSGDVDRRRTLRALRQRLELHKLAGLEPQLRRPRSSTLPVGSRPSNVLPHAVGAARQPPGRPAHSGAPTGGGDLLARQLASESGPPADRETASTAAPDGEYAAGEARAGEPDTVLTVLAELADRVRACQACRLAQGRTQTVFGVGSPSARLFIVGEGPGYEEDQRGEPFVGEAGQLLNRILAAMGLSREEVYIANVVKCRPPKNRTPEPDEMAACAGFLESQIVAVQPQLIVTLGATAARALLGGAGSVGRLRGRVHEWRGIAVVPTYHPAYLLRTPAAKRSVWEDMQLAMARLGLGDST